MTTRDTKSPLLVAAANDYQVVVDGVADLLAGAAGRVDLVSTETGAGAADDLAHLSLDLVLLDPFAIEVPLAEAVGRFVGPGRPPVVVLTWYRSAAAIATALDRGARGYVSKALTPGQLGDALEAIHAGETLVVPTERWSRTAPRGDWPGRADGLTPREAEILCLIATGLTNQEITAYTHVGKESLKTHIRAAYRKIGVTRRTQAIVWCIAHGLGRTGHRG